MDIAGVERKRHKLKGRETNQKEKGAI